jgi:hypothetical protein
VSIGCRQIIQVCHQLMAMLALGLSLVSLASLVSGGLAGAAPDRRPVAVIDITGDADARVLANSVASELARHPRLVPISDATLAAAMVAPVQDLAASSVSNANDAIQSAEESLSRFATTAAIAQATSGLLELERVEPTTAHMAMYWQLAFVIGRAALTDRNPQLANRWFSLAARVAPSARPDPARYVSNVLSAFQTAAQATAAPTTLTVAGEGAVWVDGVARGNAPLTMTTTIGPHLIHLVAFDRMPIGAQSDLTAGGTNNVSLRTMPASTSIAVLRLRASLQAAPDATARASAMNLLARLTNVQDAILISRDATGLLLTAWSSNAPGFSRATTVSEMSIANLLEKMAPPSVVLTPDDKPVTSRPLTPVVVQPWFRRRWVQASIATTVVAVAVGLVVGITYQPERRDVTQNPEWK